MESCYGNISKIRNVSLSFQKKKKKVAKKVAKKVHKLRRDSERLINSFEWKKGEAM